MNRYLMDLSGLISKREAANQLVACNRRTAEYGLQLSERQAAALVDARNTALTELDRIEFGGGMLTKLLLVFRDSPYLNQTNYLQTLTDLVHVFYYFKNETLDEISDDDLLACMKECFNTRCAGSVELMSGRELERMARHLRFGWEYRRPDDRLYREMDDDTEEEESDD